MLVCHCKPMLVRLGQLDLATFKIADRLSAFSSESLRCQSQTLVENKWRRDERDT